MHIQPLILAAGKGTRMRSKKPKVLQTVGGKTMLSHVLDACGGVEGVGKAQVVVGFEAEQIQACFGNGIGYVYQKEQLGTGHAVLVASGELADDSVVLILYGDVPFTTTNTLTSVVEKAKGGALSLLTVVLDDSTGYGRILRDASGAVIGIVEQKDASDEQCAIREVNTGIMAVQGKQLKKWVNRLSNDNAQGEYYLTDIVSMAVAESISIEVTHPHSENEVLGANDRSQLAYLEHVYRAQKTDALMASGVSLIDPNRVDVRGDLVHGQDVCIDINVVFEGSVELGSGVVIDANCVIKNSKISDNTHIRAFSHLEGASVGADSVIGPYARLREGSIIGNQAKIGNFVETKNIQLGDGSKASHLSYLGDSEIGTAVNIGAGTITCNYDGKNKHKTSIEDGVFVGSNSALVAPVVVGKNATVAAGSVVTKNVDADDLCIVRAKQRSLKNWVRPDQKEDKD